METRKAFSRRLRHETTAMFMERAASRLKSGQSLDTPGGPLCRVCAPFTGYRFDAVYLSTADCYNCDGRFQYDEETEVTRGGKREGAGRKPMRDETARCTVQVRVTDAEKRVMTEAAARTGKSVSEWLRKLGLDAATR